MNPAAVKSLWAWGFGLSGVLIALSPLPLRAMGIKDPVIPLASQLSAIACWYLGRLDSREAEELEELQECDRTWGHEAKIKQQYEYHFPTPAQAEAKVEAAATVAEPVVVPAFDVQEVISEAVGVGLLGNSGSGKSCVAKLIAGGFGESQIIVFDSHDDPEQSNWEGLTVLRDNAVIVNQMKILLDLLDQRDKTPLVIVADEWPAIRHYCKREGISNADDFLIRMSSEGRKFNKFCLFCSQSGNTKALGLEGLGDFLENFMLIRLQKVAIKYSRNLSDRSVIKWLQSQAYGMLIGDEPVIHPTHGHHQQVYKGASPRGLTPLRSLPLTIPLAENASVKPNSSQNQLVSSLKPEMNASNRKDEPLNRIQGKQFTGFQAKEPKFSIAPKTTATTFPKRANRLNQLRELRAKGLNKEQCILALWEVKKGGSQKYQDASEMYEAMLKELEANN